MALDGYKSFNNPLGTYGVGINNVKHSGFSSEISADGIITNSVENDFEGCLNNPIPIFILPKERNTANKLQTKFD